MSKSHNQQKGLNDLPKFKSKRAFTKALKESGLSTLKKLQAKSDLLKWWQKYVPFLNKEYLSLHEEINELKNLLKELEIIPKTLRERINEQKALAKARYIHATEMEKKLANGNLPTIKPTHLNKPFS